MYFCMPIVTRSPRMAPSSMTTSNVESASPPGGGVCSGWGLLYQASHAAGSSSMACIRFANSGTCF